MDGQIGGVDGVGRSAVGKLGAGEVEPQSIGAGHQVYQRLEVRLRDGPLCRGEVVVESADGDCAVNGLLRWITNGPMDKKNLLIGLATNSGLANGPKGRAWRIGPAPSFTHPRVICDVCYLGRVLRYWQAWHLAALHRGAQASHPGDAVSLGAGAAWDGRRADEACWGGC